MNTPVIEIKGLGKQYTITENQGGPLRAHEAMEKRLRAIFGMSRPAATRTFWAVKDCSLTIGRGEVVALIGPNGAGKSVLLKMLSRITKPTTGEATIQGPVSSMLEVGSGFHPDLSGRENIYMNGAILGVPRAEIDRKFDDIVAFSRVGAFLDTPVKAYSSGMYMRLAFSVSTHLDAEVMLVDEVLAVGDEAFQRRCLERMRERADRGATILLVSHSMRVVADLCTRGIYMQAGEVVYDGPIAEAIRIYEQQS